ncbi:glutathione S-transferase [Defluviimonas sp. 20V17]|uniref:Glutathione S-transferase n=1 Tax=Allgaiera indica TaxID=765699 RepID=A0AAN5A1B3_9RHOB|nr:glutathione S-transferase family protein [Allgaiera indica]KDB05190.1 glutathione S-transferase [Defluviimonas sp. 20V17]GHE05300.1 thiol:disulfide oxidoreductase [Allgaiera indica]SDX62885.1 glutathione S-transferase [Allgaiera indica]
MYLLHYAPDNASLIIRFALEEMGQPYQTKLVNRAVREQDGPEFRALNEIGLIPVLETPQGALSETGAILLWLSETHAAMAPQPGAPDRGAFLKWLFYTSNTLHADLRMLFAPRKYAPPEHRAQEMHIEAATARLLRAYGLIDRLGAQGHGWLDPDHPSVLCCYLALLLRWPQLYPYDADHDWFDLDDFPFLQKMAARLETRPAFLRAAKAEGLGPTPLSAPRHPTPPEGSAT